MSVQLVIFLIIFFAIAILAVITYCIVRPITLTHRAIEYYNSLTKLLPWYAKPYNNRGLVYFERGEYQRAIQDYNRALALNSRLFQAYNNRGLVYYKLKEYQRAIEDYDRALALNPAYVLAYVNRGVAYHDIDEYQKAIEDYNHALTLKPRDAMAYLNRGWLYHSLGEYEKAIQDCKFVLVLNPKLVQACVCIGRAYEGLGDHYRAIQSYNKALALDPSYATAYYHRGFAYLRLGNIERARVDFLKGREYDPQSVRTAWMIEWIGMCLEKPGVEEAEQLEQTAAIDPQHHDAYICRGVALWLRDKLEQALAELEQAAQIEPDADTHFWMGMIYASLKRDGQAIAAIQKSLESGLSPVLLAPLRWLEQIRPEFYENYAKALLAR